MKSKRGFGKTKHFVQLSITILDVWDIASGFMTN